MLVHRKNEKIEQKFKNERNNFLNDWKKNNEMVCSETIQEQKRKKKKTMRHFLVIFACFVL